MQLNSDDLLAAIRQYVPSIKTQAELNLFMAGFDALAQAFNSLYLGNVEEAALARQALDRVLDAASKVKGLAEQVAEIPPEQRSASAAQHVEVPREFTEIDEQRRLMAELAVIKTQRDLDVWYFTERARIAGVVSPQYRDPLFDAIRAKKISFS